MEDSTDRVLRAVDEFVEVMGFSPTIRNLSERLGCSVSTAWTWATAARVAGLLSYKERSPRTMQLTRAGRDRLSTTDQGSNDGSG